MKNTQRLHEQRVFHHTGGRPWTIYRCSSRAAPGSIPGRGTAKSTVRRDGAGVGGAGARGTQITVVSYNVLADSLVSFDYIPYCKSWNDAAWKARPGRTLDKVSGVFGGCCSTCLQPGVVSSGMPCRTQVSQRACRICYSVVRHGSMYR